MSQPIHAADETTTAEDRRDSEYDDAQATARGRREAEYGAGVGDRAEGWDAEPERADGYPAEPGRAEGHAESRNRSDAYTDERTDVLDESTRSPQQRTMVEEEPVRAPGDGNLPPGRANDPVAALWGADLVERYRSEWRDLQLTFVDDPHRATAAAASLVDDAVTSLTTALHAQKQSLDDWQTTRGEDTEVMRVALRNYRGFLDRLLGL